MNVEELVLRDRAAWRRWLGSRGQESAGEWLVLARKGKHAPTRLSYDDALEEALCFGWIDGQKRSRDEASFVQRFTPRRSRSAWSQRNVALAEGLIESGRMTPAGLREVERARADGRWAAAYAGQASMPVPGDLRVALDAHPPAALAFDRLSSQNRYAVLLRIDQAKRADTRLRRIEVFAAMLARGEAPHPQSSPILPGDPA
ncbi:MAG: YdeI/OmpD-associated family protein [Actinomycetota bacterium]|nr:YdeI/OmpD-associated family protein [Actinomycetota bacterium]